jgi:hypothetical protein
MSEPVRRSAKEGLAFGVLAGIVFAMAEAAAAGVMGESSIMPFRMFASVLLGGSALSTAPAGTVLAVGSIVHLGLSAAFGAVYGLISSRFSIYTLTHWGRQAGLGIAYGCALWLINFQVIARLIYPWFVSAQPFQQVLLHGLAFGLPLGLMYAAAERRVHHIGEAAHPR